MTHHDARDRHDRTQPSQARRTRAATVALLALAGTLWVLPACAWADGPVPTDQPARAEAAEAVLSPGEPDAHDSAHDKAAAPSEQLVPDAVPSDAEAPESPAEARANPAEAPEDPTGGLAQDASSAATSSTTTAEGTQTQDSSPADDATGEQPSDSGQHPSAPKVASAPPTGAAALASWAREHPFASFPVIGAAILIIALLVARMLTGSEQNQGSSSPSYHRHYHYVL